MQVKEIPAAEEIRTNGFDTELAVMAWGDPAAPPLLALHGWLDNAATWSTLVPYLDQYRIYAMDFSGHGNSTHRPAGSRLHFVDHVGDVMAVANALGLEEFVLMGHSMGAGVASYVAGTFPERVSKLVLIESLGSVTTEENEAPETLRQSIEAGLRYIERQGSSVPVYPAFDDAVKARMKGIGQIGEEAARILCERGVMETEGGYTWKTDPRLRLPSSIRFTEALCNEFLKKVTAPVLVIYGKQGFLDTRASNQARIASVNDIRLVDLPGGHHLHLVESSAEVAGEINRFLS